MHRRQKVGEFFGLADHGARMGVENVAQDELLRQDDAALRRRRVDGNDKHHLVARREQIGRNTALMRGRFPHVRKSFLQLVCARARARACKNFCASWGDRGVGVGGGDNLGDGSVGGARCGSLGSAARTRSNPFPRQKVGLVAHHDEGQPELLEQGDQLVLGCDQRARGVGHEHGHVAGAQGLARALDAAGTQLPDVVDTGGVHDVDRPQRQKLHSLAHRVGRGAGDIAHKRHLLPAHRVHQARLASIAHAEEPDPHALA